MLLTTGPSEGEGWQALRAQPDVATSSKVLLITGPSESEGWQALGVGPQRKLNNVGGRESVRLHHRGR